MRRIDNLTTFMCPLPENPGSLKLLEPPGFMQACTGIALHLRPDSLYIYTCKCKIQVDSGL